MPDINYGMEDEAATPASPTAAPEMETEDKGPVSVFVKPDALGGKVKEGDTVTMTVKSVDPETGEAELVCECGKGETEAESKPGWSNRMDEMMSEE